MTYEDIITVVLSKNPWRTMQVARCEACKATVRLHSQGCSMDPESPRWKEGKLDYSTVRGWGGGLNEYYCAVCGGFVFRSDTRTWYGPESEKPPREKDYGPERIEPKPAPRDLL